MSTKPDYFTKGERARLIPVAADSSKEVRATSVFLATMMAVPPFAERMLDTIGQKVGKRSEIACFTEVGFKQANGGKNHRPDGFVSLSSGRGRQWTALVEAKIGNAEIDAEQVKAYATLAKEHGIDAVITISNQFSALPTHTPVEIGRVLSRNVGLFHWSWMFILTEAMLLISDDNFDAPEQKFILSELVRYLSHDSVGVKRFDRMNKEWKDVVLAVNARTALNKNTSDIQNTVAAWHQEARDVTLLMTRKVQRRVRQKLSRAHANDPSTRLSGDAEKLAGNHVLDFVRDIPDAADALEVQADIARRCLICSMTLEAPDTKRLQSRINWLLKQLTNSNPSDVWVEMQFPGKVPPVRVTLVQLRAEEGLNQETFPSSLPTAFKVMMVKDIAGKFSGSRTFIEELEKFVPEFYENVGQLLESFRPKPPQLKAEKAESASALSEDSAKGLRDVSIAANDAAEDALEMVLASKVEAVSSSGDEEEKQWPPLVPSPEEAALDPVSPPTQYLPTTEQ